MDVPQSEYGNSDLHLAMGMPLARRIEPEIIGSSCPLTLRFSHGLGDCVYFAHQLPLYVRRGFDITVVCNPDKEFLFRESGVKVIHDSADAPVIPWWPGHDFDRLDREHVAASNKSAANVGKPPLPEIGDGQTLWDELCAVRLDLRSHIGRDDWEAVHRFLEDLPRPIVLLHTKGNTFQDQKSLPDESALQLYSKLLDRMPGTLVLLDWDNRVPRLASYRVRHLLDDWERPDVRRLMALLYESDLIVGIDSGPLHAARFTDTPSVGMFPTREHYPARWFLPRANQVNVVPAGLTHLWNREVRIAFNIVESPGESISPDAVANVCAQMLAGPRYLPTEHLGADIQLQQFVREWERSSGGGLSAYVDRHTTFDWLFRELPRRFRKPLIVETGCIRSPEDWAGAGYSTYLFGVLLERLGGTLFSVDLDSSHCEFARRATRELSCVNIACQDSVEFLGRFSQPIDVLYLDSRDEDIPGSEEHALRELEAAFPMLHARSIVVFDDTVYKARQFLGKGSLAVPWLLDRGWRIINSGYQTMLGRLRI